MILLPQTLLQCIGCDGAHIAIPQTLRFMGDAHARCNRRRTYGAVELIRPACSGGGLQTSRAW